MRVTRVLQAGVAVAAAVALLGACGGGGNAGSGGDKKLTVGIKFDQPGLGQKTGTGYEGFDVDVATFVAKELGVDAKNINWVEAKSADRESLLKKGDVDFIAATYSITEKRKTEVDFVGPYLVTGQDLLVKADNTAITGPESVNGKKLCSVKGSTSADTVVTRFAKEASLQQVDGYSQCLSGLDTGTIDVLTTDATILAGLAAKQPGKYKLVGKTFTTENYGIGLKKGDARKADIAKAVEKFYSSGEWKKAIEKNLGSIFKVGEPPALTEK
ncbi:MULTISPECIES: glutamate ABC transporter substrate-binding protein [unclassified Crossiella]|uniref:glutamate ABC transporter substrate-binding protein n=1 Tax=unclassified Crossiella TaxID=2620835 RepID=UPI001FFE34B4|nr:MULTISPECIES: glutamate ABC transporter substrate-binding protein [unclassified Crossiella]MCK2240233.1 glutamate ABC transporter substrate-binding protein [Crossiella sp. S99.2]MCK2253315.1 glutamate ABC transporter substrate-binding protein [Crossiella sp. S99.1]